MSAIRMGLALLSALVLASCGVRIDLAPPPNLYSEGSNFPADRVAASLRSAQPSLFYVTDRAPEEGGYGTLRSSSMAFGRAQVSFGKNLNWDDLVRRTQFDSSSRIERLDVVAVDEQVRFRDTPLPYARSDGYLRILDDADANYAAQANAFKQAIRDEIARTGNRRALVYIHGFNNDFEDSLTTLANLWHFSARETIPIAFTWPAGAGSGPLGYFRDRDSGQFAVFHAKEFLRILAEIPEIDQIDIVAHSRGNDVATTALRERIIEARGAGLHPKTALKTGTFIMAAPDLDLDIVRQRLASERFSEAFEQINLYINPEDRALRLSAILTDSTRLGAITDADFLPGEQETLEKEALVHFIRVEDVSGRFGHAYFRDNPAVLSDIVLALRTRAFPGGTLRPLQREPGARAWVLYPNYPLDRLPNLDLLEERRREIDAR